MYWNEWQIIVDFMSRQTMSAFCYVICLDWLPISLFMYLFQSAKYILVT